MKSLLTPIALAMNGATLAGLWLANGEALSDYAPAGIVITALVSLTALATKAGAR